MTTADGRHDVEAGPVRRAGLPRAENTDRWVVGAFALAAFAAGMAESAWVPAVAAGVLGRSGAGGGVEAAVAGLALVVAGVVLLPIFGGLADRWPRKPVAAGALGTLVVGAVLAAGAGDPGALAWAPRVGFGLLEGVGVAGVVASTWIAAADLTPPLRRGAVLGLFGGAWAAGLTAGPLTAGPLAAGRLWAVPVAAAVALALVLVRMPRLEPIAGAAVAAEAAAFRGSAVARSRVLRNATLASLLLGAVGAGAAVCLPLFLVRGLGLPPGAAGLALVPYGVATAAAAVVAGWTVSRVEHLRDLVLVPGFVLLGGALFLSRMTTHVEGWRVTLYLVMAGAGVGPALALLPLAVQNAAHVRVSGRTTGVTLFAGGAGFLVGGAAALVLFAHTLASAYAAIAVPQTVAGLVAPQGGVLGAWDPPAGGRLPSAIEEAYGDLADSVDAVARSADTTAIRALTTHPDLPERVAIQLDELATAGAVYADSAEAARVGARLAGEVRAQGSDAAAEAAVSAREAYRTAAHRVYAAVLVAAMVALFFTFRIPELPLRRAPDRVAPLRAAETPEDAVPAGDPEGEGGGDDGAGPPG